jgi:plastocyanin
MSGTALDLTAPSGTGAGISEIQAFMGNRDLGGTFIGATTVGGIATTIPGAWTLSASIPQNVNGFQDMFVYGTSSVTGQQAFVSIPVVVAGTTSAIEVPDQSTSFCPETITPAIPIQPPTTGVQLSISTPLLASLSFSTNVLMAPAGAQVTLTYTNNSPLAHNWHVFNGPDATASTLAMTNIITGPGASDSVTFTAPTQPGSYFFQCDVHPTIMTGTLQVM